MAVAPPAIEARELYRFYHIGDEETLALRGVSLIVNPGEMVAVVGPSGSGKSTLMACLAGLDEPDGGFVYVNGERLTRRDEAARTLIRSRLIGLLLQSGNLFDHLTVRQNVALKMRFAGQSDEARIDEVLELVGIGARRHAYPSQLSGGEASRAGLAVVLAPRPPIIIADEPTGEVDSETEQGVLAIFDRHRADGGASLIVTHSEAIAGRADRIVRLEDGKVARG
ncbi:MULTISPECIES: ABC transporter ATP-binding protein [unclassified Brevundimonas]|uniref:ABC transporter ATP-binding protein n=1 Tax=unclassified Brevundimonas TaxID=2622653 RepID=UPI003F8DA201